MPAVPQPAATVILLRNASPSPEVLLLERHARSQFLPDLYVFPGGRVDAADGTLAERVGGFDASALSRLGDFDSERLHAFLVAAVRETFEEAGILLARRRGEAALLDADAVSDLARYRLDIQAGRHSFADLVESEKLELAADRLALHARWITPEGAPQRYDTLFFTAVAPAGQRAEHDGVEATAHVWIRPEEALRQRETGERQIIFPTAQNLRVVAEFRAPEAALEASRLRPIVPVLPRIEERDGRKLLVIRDDAGYPTHEESLPPPAKR